MKLVITSFPAWFLIQINYVSELMKLIPNSSVSDLFSNKVSPGDVVDLNLDHFCIMAHRPYPGRDIIEVLRRSTG